MTEEQPTGTAGSLASIPGLTHTFLVMNGDVLTTLDLHALVAFHKASGACVTIAAHRREVRSDFGVLEVDGEHRVTGYREKPIHTYDVSMGVYVYEPDVLQLIEPRQYLDFPDLVLKLLSSGKRVSLFRTTLSGSTSDVPMIMPLLKACMPIAPVQSMDSWSIPLSDLDFGPKEESAALRVLRSKWLTMGAEVQKFEEAFVRFIGVRHAVATSSGTAAIHMRSPRLEYQLTTKLFSHR